VTGARNVISGNTGFGVSILGAGSGGNQVAGNYIGTNAAGTGGVPNQGRGVQVEASNNAIGGTADGAGNLIAFNTRSGVAIVSGVSNAVFRNAIFGNGGLGIDLIDDGVTPQRPERR
jgi:hypothetical protein